MAKENTLAWDSNFGGKTTTREEALSALGIKPRGGGEVGEVEEHYERVTTNMGGDRRIYGAPKSAKERRSAQSIFLTFLDDDSRAAFTARLKETNPGIDRDEIRRSLQQVIDDAKKEIDHVISGTEMGRLGTFITNLEGRPVKDEVVAYVRGITFTATWVVAQHIQHPEKTIESLVREVSPEFLVREATKLKALMEESSTPQSRPPSSFR
ncbi:MAG: hypothetical protein U1E36_06530 [Rickettsiales bacterium]